MLCKRNMCHFVVSVEVCRVPRSFYHKRHSNYIFDARRTFYFTLCFHAVVPVKLIIHLFPWMTAFLYALKASEASPDADPLLSFSTEPASTTYRSLHTLVNKCWSWLTRSTPPWKFRMDSISASVVSKSKWSCLSVPNEQWGMGKLDSTACTNGRTNWYFGFVAARLAVSTALTCRFIEN
jgi:hypothetical protein